MPLNEEFIKLHPESLKYPKQEQQDEKESRRLQIVESSQSDDGVQEQDTTATEVDIETENEN